MTNLEWIKTLTPEQITEVLYCYWLKHGQVKYNDASLGLIHELNMEHTDAAEKEIMAYCHFTF